MLMNPNLSYTYQLLCSENYRRSEWSEPLRWNHVVASETYNVTPIILDKQALHLKVKSKLLVKH